MKHFFVSLFHSISLEMISYRKYVTSFKLLCCFQILTRFCTKQFSFRTIEKLPKTKSFLLLQQKVISYHKLQTNEILSFRIIREKNASVKQALRKITYRYKISSDASINGSSIIIFVFNIKLCFTFIFHYQIFFLLH